MLLSIVFRAQVLIPGILHADQGRALNDVFLGWVQAVDPGLSAALHDMDGRKPFTVSGLNGANTNARGEVPLRLGEEVWWRVTSMDPVLSNILRTSILPGLPGREMELGDRVSFKIITACINPLDHPWARESSCEALYNLYESSSPPEDIHLEFASPTFFHSGGKSIVLPHADLMIGSWLEQWNAATSVRLLEDIRAMAREIVAVRHYDLETRVVFHGKRIWTGFLGVCMIQILTPDTYYRRLIHLLADFAFFSGTGAKTAFGLGQTRIRT